MLERLVIKGIKNLPRLYIAHNNVETQIALDKGIPFIKWKDSTDILIKYILRPVLESKFPHIDWDKQLGVRPEVSSKVIISNNIAEQKPDKHNAIIGSANIDDVATQSTDRSYPNAATQDNNHCEIDILNYLNDATANVNIEVLEGLKLLPAFIGDVRDCIISNISAKHWREGYNKKLGAAVGNFSGGGIMRNLVILDISVSIPRGIAATMLSLIDTLRYQLGADLIITGGNSVYFRCGEEIPDIEHLYIKYGGYNETDKFLEILENHIFHREWGHLVIFGDNNHPDITGYPKGSYNTKIHELHNYHTLQKKRVGYACWVYKPDKETFNTSWCSLIKEDKEQKG